MKFLGPVLGLVLVVVGFFAPIVVMSFQIVYTRHFFPVTPGVLYRSAQLPVGGLQRLVHDFGIRTVVCIRETDSPAVTAERKWCALNEIKFVRIDTRNWDGTPGRARVDPCLRQFLDVMRDKRNHPVLVHCFAGVHRTGGYVAVYRMECENWDNQDAIEEMRGRGYATIDTDQDIRQYLEAYRPGILATRTAQR